MKRNDNANCPILWFTWSQEELIIYVGSWLQFATVRGRCKLIYFEYPTGKNNYRKQLVKNKENKKAKNHQKQQKQKHTNKN